MTPDRREFLVSYLAQTAEFKEYMEDDLTMRCRRASLTEMEAVANMAIIRYIRDLLDVCASIDTQTLKGSNNEIS